MQQNKYDLSTTFEANDDLEGIVKEQNVSPVEKSKSATVARKKII